jgi:hypothetical protein
MPAPAHVQAATLEKFIDDWRTITPESWTALWADDCTQRFLPYSLGIPPQTRDEVLVMLPKLLSILENWKVSREPVDAASFTSHDILNSE